ncbi:hypothetical protein QVM52_28240, partial [Pseudomonas mosselii]|uniref:hypothetical protein n=1 Tax=Pseudomonas mosselii TaxID=78327 RepID=UPI001E48A28B
ADLVKVRACLTAGRYRPAHKKSDTSEISVDIANKCAYNFQNHLTTTTTTTTHKPLNTIRHQS